MIKGEIEGFDGLSKFMRSDFIEDVSAISAGSASRGFVEFLRNTHFDKLFNDQTGETKSSIDTYRYRGKNPAYVVKAGVRIPGNLNYLAGLYRGRARTKSGKIFQYGRPRDLIIGGWKAYGGYEKLAATIQRVLNKKIEDAEKEMKS